MFCAARTLFLKRKQAQCLRLCIACGSNPQAPAEYGCACSCTQGTENMPAMVAGMFPCSKKEPGAHSAPGNACKHGLKKPPKETIFIKKDDRQSNYFSGADVYNRTTVNWIKIHNKTAPHMDRRSNNIICIYPKPIYKQDFLKVPRVFRMPSQNDNSGSIQADYSALLQNNGQMNDSKAHLSL